MVKHNFFIAKFGKLEHLEMLKNGILHLSPISNYRNDSTLFRGDENEGCIPINPASVKINGVNIPNIEGCFVKQTLLNDDSILMFCASIINKACLRLDSDGYSVLTEKFRQAVRPFGSSVLLINATEITNKLSAIRLNHIPEFGYDSGPITYRNINDFSNSEEYKKAYTYTGSIYDRYFVKDVSYKEQNEWRLIVDGSYAPLPANLDGSYEIDIGSLDSAMLYDTDVFLNTFQVKLQ